jgi:hypothetical protein
MLYNQNLITPKTKWGDVSSLFNDNHSSFQLLKERALFQSDYPFFFFKKNYFSLIHRTDISPVGMSLAPPYKYYDGKFGYWVFYMFQEQPF